MRCGRGQLVCLDGVSASGKSSLASELATELRRAGVTVRVLHTDQMLHGWRGLTALSQTLAALVQAWANGHSGLWREWDWHAGAWAGTHTEPPPGADEVVLLEGVGSAAGPHRRLAAVSVWLETSPAEQSERWVNRDGLDSLADLAPWQADEQELHARWRTRENADLVAHT